MGMRRAAANQGVRAAIAATLLAVGACGDNVHPTPDGGLPLCADVGCPSTDLFCSADGVCSCVVDGEAVQCLAEAE